MKLHRHLSFVCVYMFLGHVACVVADDEPLFRWQLNRENSRGSTVSPQFGSVDLSSPVDLQFDVLSPQAAIFNSMGETKQFLNAGAGLKFLMIYAYSWASALVLRLLQNYFWDIKIF